MKITLIVSGILVSIFVLFLLFAPTTEEANKSNIPTADRLEDRTDIVENADIENKPRLIIGNPDAKVTLVEYGDFKCPSCGSFNRQAGEQIRDEYIDKGEVNIEFRNYPFIGPDSGRAARGSYCANDQGIFTEYHDGVYNYIWENYYSQDDLAAEFRDVVSTEIMIDIIKDDLRDVALFESCMATTEYNRFIDADLLLGADDGVSGTPGFVIAGNKVNGPSNFNTFKTLFDIELRK